MTAALALAARLLLAAVLALAGAAKLGDRSGLRETLVSFGLPPRRAALGAVALPPAELAVAVLLVPASTARWGAAGAALLLDALCAAVARSLTRGERPDCGCFGRMRATPIGPATLVRNVSLAAAAAFVVAAGPGEGLGEALPAIDLSPLAIALVAVAAVVLIQGWFAWELFRQHGRLLGRIRSLEEGAADAPDGLPLGAQAPPLETLEPRLLSRGPVALVFSNTGCGACAVLAPELDRLREEPGLEILLVEDDRAALEAYRIPIVPAAVIVGVDGRIASPTATGPHAVAELLASAADPGSHPLRLAVG